MTASYLHAFGRDRQALFAAHLALLRMYSVTTRKILGFEFTIRGNEVLREDKSH